jgi:hypothetical protein
MTYTISNKKLSRLHLLVIRWKTGDYGYLKVNLDHLFALKIIKANIIGRFCNVFVIFVCSIARKLTIKQENPHEFEVLMALTIKIMIIWM